MHRRLRWLTILVLFLAWSLCVPSTHVRAGASDGPAFQEEEPTEEPATEPPEETTPQPSLPQPADIINAVNDFRIMNGLPTLAVHQALMDVAAQTANALAGTEGAAGHFRPCDMTLGELLLVRDFALWGDLSQDGYRSENWVSAQTVEQAMAFWKGDDLHLDTMLDVNRSHIGAAVAVGDQIYMVIETALQTPSGKMQWGADVYLTQAAAKQTACAGGFTKDGEYDLSQYSVPVALSTARPDGDVVHEVKYGQTLWSIAIQYGTTIERIKRLNNLSSDTVVPGWKLLVVKGATQPPPATASPSGFQAIKQELTTPTPQLTSTPTATGVPSVQAGKFVKQNSTVVVALLISFSVLVAAIVGFRKKQEE